MNEYLIIYIVIGIGVTIACVSNDIARRHEKVGVWLGSIFIGATWPVFIIAKLVQRIT